MTKVEIQSLFDAGLKAWEEKNAHLCLQIANKLHAIAPDDVLTHQIYASAAILNNRPDIALLRVNAALETTPANYYPLLLLKGEALRLSWRHDEAEVCIKEVVDNSKDSDACVKLATIYRDKDNYEQAHVWMLEAYRRAPKSFRRYINLAFCALVTAQPSTQVFRWHASRPRRVFCADICTPILTHSTQALHLHVHHDMDLGLGDHLFYMRYLPLVKAAGHHISYTPHPKIASLMHRVPYIDTFLPLDARTDADLVLYETELPLLLNAQQATIIPDSLVLPPLEEELKQVQALLQTLGPPPYFAVTWTAGPIHQQYIRNGSITLPRRIEPAVLGSALKGLPATFLVLQRQPNTEDYAAFEQALGTKAHDLSAFNDDLESMFALLSLVEEYIGVSNTNSHLRNLVPKHARVLLNRPTQDWAYLAHGKTSPWHKEALLYRQAFAGDWQEAMATLSTDLIAQYFKTP
ncbi:MAG: hypothetical protein HOP21_06570 [Methylotenera sp.]|nr:hypothetical protein [Methylotenera sp.]